MTTVNNNRAPIAATEASFEDQLAIALAASKEEAAAAPAPVATNESQQKALEAAHDAAQRQKEVLKASEPDAPAPASASASSSSAAAATSSSSSTEDKDLEAAIKASLEPATTAAAPKADAFPPLTPTTNEAWVDKEITGPAKFAIKMVRPILLSLYSAKITPAAKEIIKNLDIDKLNTLGDVEKAMIPLINMCEPNEALRASSHIDAKTCFKLYAEKGVFAAIAYAKNPT